MRNRTLIIYSKSKLHKRNRGSALSSIPALVLSATLLFPAVLSSWLAIDVSGATGARLLPPQLDSIIDGLQRKYSRMRGLEADFVQIYQGANGQTARETGHLLLKRPGKARWQYNSPERKLFVSDGKNIYFHVEGERQAAQTTVKESVDPQIPFLFLLGRGNLRRDFSRIEVAGNEQPVGAGNVVLRLLPKRAPEEFKQLLVEVEPSNFEVKRMVIFERNGSRMDFLLSNVRENYLAPDTEFQFTPPQGVTIRKAR